MLLTVEKYKNMEKIQSNSIACFYGEEERIRELLKNFASDFDVRIPISRKIVVALISLTNKLHSKDHKYVKKVNSILYWVLKTISRDSSAGVYYVMKISNDARKEEIINE